MADKWIAEEAKDARGINDKFPEIIGPYVYGLVDPNNFSVYYVGRTGNLWARFQAHFSFGSRGRVNPYKLHWLACLRRRGQEPLIVILDTAWHLPFKERQKYIKEQEAYWVNRLAEEGHLLLNEALIPMKQRSRIRSRYWEEVNGKAKMD